MKCLKDCARCCWDLVIEFPKSDFVKLASRFPEIDYEKLFENDLHVVFRGCPFMRDNLCLIYEDRPQFCKMYPIVPNDDCSQMTLTTACPNFAMVTRQDVSNAKRAYAAYRGEQIRIKNHFIQFHSIDVYKKMNREAFSFVEKINEELNKNEGNEISLKIDVDKYLEIQKNNEQFVKWIAELKEKQGMLNQAKKGETKLMNT